MSLTSLLHGKNSFKKPAHKLLYIYLYSFKDCEKTFPSIDSIAAVLCVTRRTAITLIQEMEKENLIEVKRVQGESNTYQLKEIEENTRHEESNTGEEITPEPVKELHPTNNSIKNISNTNNSNLTKETKETIINSLITEYPNVPVTEIAESLESDSSVVVRTINQFKGLLSYRVRNYKPVKRNIKKSDSVLVDNYESLTNETSLPAPGVDKNSVMNKILQFRNA